MKITNYENERSDRESLLSSYFSTKINIVKQQNIKYDLFEFFDDSASSAR